MLVLETVPLPTLLSVLLASWPSPDAGLLTRPLPDGRGLRLAVDPGHGAPNNPGNFGCRCQREADETLAEATALTAQLRDAGFTVLQTRTTADGPSYRRRIAALEAFAPHLVLSLHTDARGDTAPFSTAPDGGVCWANVSDPGFSVLWSEEGPSAVVEARARWGRALSAALLARGFGAYSGDDYPGLYLPDAQPGCFIDAHVPRQRVYFLRATSVVPIVIVETHHALDPQEVARWREAETLAAFGSAVAWAAVDVLRAAHTADAGVSVVGRPSPRPSTGGR